MKSGSTRVLLLSGVSAVAFPSAGPTRSIEGLVTNLTDIDWRLISSAQRVDGTTEPSAIVDRWTQWHGVPVWYCADGRLSLVRFRQIVREVNPDMIYLNSVFDREFALVPLLALLIGRGKPTIVVAPRGELSPGALQYSAAKKRVALGLLAALRWTRRVTFHGSTELEASEIRSTTSARAHVVIARNLRAKTAGQGQDNQRHNPPHASRSLVFLSRIVPKKNLHGVIEALAGITEPVDFTIAGPTQEPQYWERCLKALATLPASVTVNVVGEVPNESVIEYLGGHGLLVLPTFGENFGHVIAESLLAGTPVLIGEETPWSDVAQEGSGWIVDPRRVDQIRNAVSNFLAMDETQRRAQRIETHRYAEKAFSAEREDFDVAANRALFAHHATLSGPSNG